MAVLSKGVDFTTGDQVSAANFDNLVDSATFASGAVDNVTTQLSGGAIIVKDGGIGSSQLATGLSITPGIAAVTLLKLTPETGYATGGTITLTLTTATNAYIGLTTNTTLAVSGQAAGIVNVTTLKNTTAGTLTMAYPAWTAAGGSFPASLTAGQAMVITLYSYGTSLSDVFAVSSI